MRITLLGGFWRTQAWEADSEIALRDYTEEVGRPGYIGIFATENKEHIKR